MTASTTTASKVVDIVNQGELPSRAVHGSDPQKVESRRKMTSGLNVAFAH